MKKEKNFKLYSIIITIIALILLIIIAIMLLIPRNVISESEAKNKALDYGNFNEKEVVLVTDSYGNGLLKAVTNFSSSDLRALIGHKSQEIESILGKGRRDVVFRPEDTSPVEHNV